jgi:hypothetical protein
MIMRYMLDNKKQMKPYGSNNKQGLRPNKYGRVSRGLPRQSDIQTFM